MTGRSTAASATPRAAPDISPVSLALQGPNPQFNTTIQPALLQSGKNLTSRPGVYVIPYAEYPISLQIAWHFGELPQDEFNLLVLRGLNSLVFTILRKPAGNRPLDGDRVTFRSQNCFVRAVAEDRDSLSYGTLATAFRGIGEVMATWGASQAEVLIIEGRDRVGRISVEVRRAAEVD